VREGVGKITQEGIISTTYMVAAQRVHPHVD